MARVPCSRDPAAAHILSFYISYGLCSDPLSPLKKERKKEIYLRLGGREWEAKGDD